MVSRYHPPPSPPWPPSPIVAPPADEEPAVKDGPVEEPAAKVARPELSPVINSPSENQDDAAAVTVVQDTEKVIDMAVAAVCQDDVNAVRMNDDVHDETAKVIDMAVMDAMDIATKTEADEAATIPANANDSVPPTDEGVANGNDRSATIVKTDVEMGQDDGNVIKIVFRPKGSLVQTINEEQPPAKRAKKERKEFTAQEKLQILSELNGPGAPTITFILEKFGVSKSSLHRWRQPEKMERLQEMVKGSDGSGGGGDNGYYGIGNRDKTKKRDMNDKLRKIKLGLQSFCKDNSMRDENDQLAITSSLIQLKACEIKDELLKRHQVMPDVLTDEEASALQAFKGSKSWACLIGNQLGFLSAAAGNIRWGDVARANTASYVERHCPAPARPKKQRMEFTALEKLVILQELDDTNAQNRADGTSPLTVEQICQTYLTSKSSLHRWKQQYKSGRLQELAEITSGYCHSKRIFNDKLHVVKKALNKFYMENENAPMEKRVPINYTTLQAQAIIEKDVILEEHYVAVVGRIRIQQQQGEVAHPQEDDGGKADGATQQPEGKAGGGEVKKGADRIEKGEVVCGQNENSGSSGNGNDTISKEEMHALENFKASNSWLRETAKKFGWKLDTDGKKDGGVGMSVVDGMVSTATSESATAAVVYHHQDHHGMEHPAVEHAGAEHHQMAQDLPDVDNDHVVAQDHAIVAVEHAGPDQAAVVVEQGDLGIAVEGHHHHHYAQNGVIEEHHQVNNEHQHDEQQHQLLDHLAPNMAMYDAQGNVMDILEDPLVNVEDHGAGGMVDHENCTTVDV